MRWHQEKTEEPQHEENQPVKERVQVGVMQSAPVAPAWPAPMQEAHMSQPEEPK